jgi:hypothetical protein
MGMVVGRWLRIGLMGVAKLLSERSSGLFAENPSQQEKRRSTYY